MIKVNLLREQTVHVHKTETIYSNAGTALIFGAIFAIVAGAVGGWWYYIAKDIKTLTASRDELRIEDARLQGLKKQISEFENLKSQGQSRIDVIEKLKEYQTGPVLLLNHVIQSIPVNSSMWLTLLDQKGDSIHITGYTLHNESIPDFMSNLAATNFFKSVDLELLEDTKEAAKFSLVCVGATKLSSE
jgi:type IV pilus assembly protein PilN